MMQEINPLRIRQKLGRDNWEAPIELGPDIRCFKYKHENGRIFISYWWPGDIPTIEWLHASICFRDRLPTYEELKLMYDAIFPNGYAYQVFAPPSEHVTFHNNALHLWGSTDGESVLPEFSQNLGNVGRMI